MQSPDSRAARCSVALVGCGKMGGALLDGWLRSESVSSVTIIDPAPLPEKYQNNTAIKHIIDPASLSGHHDVLMMATKPQIMDGICASLSNKISKNCLVLSIAAGKSVQYFENYFGANHPVIRTMPNTPASIGKGITVACPNKNVTPDQKAIADRLLGAGGMVEWLQEESLLNAVTALSGSGPAYIFYLIETLAQSGSKLGLPSELAQKLARQTVIGSAALAEFDQHIPASTLRENVTSPGGTTQAALEILMDGRLEEIYNQALMRAKERGEELSGD